MLAYQSDLTFTKSGSMIGQLSSTYCHNMWCDQAKSVWSRSNSVFIFLTNCMHLIHSYILQKTPLKLVNCFQRYEQLKDAKNNRKQNTFSPLFGSILKNQYSRLPTDFAWSHHIWWIVYNLKQADWNYWGAVSKMISVTRCYFSTVLCTFVDDVLIIKGTFSRRSLIL